MKLYAIFRDIILPVLLLACGGLYASLSNHDTRITKNETVNEHQDEKINSLESHLDQDIDELKAKIDKVFDVILEMKDKR